MLDKALLAKGVADIRDAVARIREVLPQDVTEFARDRTIREVVVLNLFVALQQCLALAAHRLADEGKDVPAGYREVFIALADRSVLDAQLAARLATAAGLRNLIAHRYGVLNWERIHAIASTDLDDLLAFCRQLARQAGEAP
jgi:uncharacterized protein YutE (UPF0331/DUF86 family)